jgi:hypothetical protein
MSHAGVDIGALGPVRLPCQFGAVRPAELARPAPEEDDEHDDTLGREIHASLLPEPRP